VKFKFFDHHLRTQMMIKKFGITPLTELRYNYFYYSPSYAIIPDHFNAGANQLMLFQTQHETKSADEKNMTVK
jgi:hypothetical protein